MSIFYACTKQAKIFSAQGSSSFNQAVVPRGGCCLSVHLRGTGLVKGIKPGLGAKLLFTIQEPVIQEALDCSSGGWALTLSVCHSFYPGGLAQKASLGATGMVPRAISDSRPCVPWRRMKELLYLGPSHSPIGLPSCPSPTQLSSLIIRFTDTCKQAECEYRSKRAHQVLWGFCLFYFTSRHHVASYCVAQAGPGLTSFRFSLPSTEVTGVYRHAQR